MMKPTKKVIVRVEVTDGEYTVEKTVRKSRSRRLHVKPYKINYPTSAAAAATSQDGDGVNYVSASGTAPSGCDTVYGLVYPQLSPNYPDEPPVDNPYLQSAEPDLGGNWYFDAMHDNELPGAACGTALSGPNNNTLVVWYTFADNTPTETENSPFYAVCAPPPPLVPPIATSTPVLHATFQGALETLGSAALHFDKGAWAGVMSGDDQTVVVFFRTNGKYTMMAGGPGTAFRVTAPPLRSKPFFWGAAGEAMGQVCGAFEVKVEGKAAVEAAEPETAEAPCR